MAVAYDTDPLRIGYSHFDGFGYRSLRIGHQLGYEGVVGGLGITEHWHGGPI